MEDLIRRTLGFIMLDWPVLVVTVLIARWIWRGDRRPRQ